MTKDTTLPLDENTRRYYLDAMGVQCWESIDSPQTDRQAVTQAIAQGASRNVDGDKTDVDAVSWPQLEEAIQQCQLCALHETRKQALTGRGNRSPELMFIVLSPSVQDDENGMVCSSDANELFTRMLAAIDIDIDDVYISSLLKCAVPVNHTVTPKEIHACYAHLKQQIQLIRPKLLVVLGATAVRCLLQKDLSIDDLRSMNPGMSPGESDQEQHQIDEIPLFVSYSPEELLLEAENKRKAWSDLQQLQMIITSKDQ